MKPNLPRSYGAQGIILFAGGCAGLLFLLTLTGCGPSGDDASSRGASEPQPSQSQSYGSGAANSRQRQAEFLNHLRQSDPNYQTIEKAVLNENNELGLILNRSVEMESIPKLMRAMLTQLNKEFPGQDLTVVAYAPTQPPARIGTGHFDARTSAITYTPETPATR